MVFFNIFEKHSNGMDHLVIEKIIGKEVTKVINLTCLFPTKKRGSFTSPSCISGFFGDAPHQKCQGFFN